MHKRTAKTVTISGPTLDERNRTRRIHVDGGEEWFGIGGSDRVGARDRDGARTRANLDVPSPQVVEQHDGCLDNADVWELATILIGMPGALQQAVYEEMVMGQAGGRLKVRHGECGRTFTIERCV